MKKLVVILIAAALALSLCGCSLFHQHTWEEATCTEPKTCTECGATEGEELGHDWEEATCTEPKTCARCGKTKGEALGHDWSEESCTEPKVCARCGATEEAPGHDWKEATCTEPKTCARCGETEGEPLGHNAPAADYWSASICTVCGEELAPQLTPDFEKYGLEINMELNTPCDYVTVCYNKPEAQTVARATITNYEILPSAENYEYFPGSTWNLEAREGWEWRIVTVEIVFYDENANEWGWSISPTYENYYDVVYNDENGREDEVQPASGYSGYYKIVYKGEEYDCHILFDRYNSGWIGDEITWKECRAYQVPVGYDGFVLCLRDAGVEWGDGQYIYDVADENTLFFRLA